MDTTGDPQLHRVISGPLMVLVGWAVVFTGLVSAATLVLGLASNRTGLRSRSNGTS